MVDYRPLVDNIDPVAALTLGKLDSTPRAGGLPPHEGGALALRSGAAGGGWTGPHCPVQGTESLALGSELTPLSPAAPIPSAVRGLSPPAQGAESNFPRVSD